MGISIYVTGNIPHSLFQSLIDITLSYFYSIDHLSAEVPALEPEVDAPQIVNSAMKFIIETYGLTEEQASDLLSKTADRQGRTIRDSFSSIGGYRILMFNTKDPVPY
jgi:response regulator NasT